MPESKRACHAAFFWSKQEIDGGFFGRERGSDLYYTAFALRGLAMLDGLDRPNDLQRVADYLIQQAGRVLSIVDVVSWLYSLAMVQAAGAGLSVPIDFTDDRVADQLSQLLESYRTDDGGYVKSAGGALGSVYHSFLVVLIYEFLGREVPAPNRLVQFVLDRQREDGGFVEIAPMKRSGTNPTSAAVVILKLLRRLDDSIKHSVGDFLTEVISDEGGFLANTRIPIADALSTFTGLLTAHEIGRPNEILSPDRCRRFIDSLEQPTGGFAGASWDQSPDAEYSFYALGTLALLNLTRKSS